MTREKPTSLLEPCTACGADETTPCPPEDENPCGFSRPDRSRLTCIKPKGHAGSHRAVCFALTRGKGSSS